jgi:DNA-directed RNA polymerase subunit RPC12/RpoP|nr:MAG TPA: DNA-directed RNA polymerase [Caudoviricetes sp.]
MIAEKTVTALSAGISLLRTVKNNERNIIQRSNSQIRRKSQNFKGVKIMTRYELERHLGKYVEIVLFDGTVIEGILHKTSEKAFENDANLSIPKLRYFCTCGDKVVSNCVFRLSHIKKISRIKIKLKVVDEVKLSKWVKKEVRKVGEAEAYCLTCGREVVYQVINNRYQFENYCPHCGAKMDKEENNA